jgi:heptosyltransferase III
MKILIINVTRIGDTLFGVPSIRAIAQHYPDAEITVLAHPSRFEVLAHLPYVKHVGGITKKTAWYRGWLGKPYDKAFVWGFDAPLIRYAARVSHEVIAHRQPDTTLNKCITHIVMPPVHKANHVVKQLLALPEGVGITTTNHRIDLVLTEAERSWARQKLDSIGFTRANVLVGFQTTSFHTRPYRDWPIENFRELANRVTVVYPQARFILFGGRDGLERNQALAADLGECCISFANQLTLRQTAAIMACLNVYVGVDTGPTHIMSTFDIPLIGLYHAKSKTHHTGPLQHPRDYCINHPVDELDADETTSMADISVEQVFGQITRALEETR